MKLTESMSHAFFRNWIAIFEEIFFKVIIFFLMNTIFTKNTTNFIKEGSPNLNRWRNFFYDKWPFGNKWPFGQVMVMFLQDRLLNFQLLNSKKTTLTEGNSPVYRGTCVPFFWGWCLRIHRFLSLFGDFLSSVITIFQLPSDFQPILFGFFR